MRILFTGEPGFAGCNPGFALRAEKSGAEIRGMDNPSGQKLKI